MLRGMGEKSAIAGIALLAAGILGSAANAADLGSDCCADLEERVAELEATTARKGNRVVSLQISGQVNESLLIWDDGGESDAYVVTNAGNQSQVTLDGQGIITPDVTAGFVMNFGIWGSPSLTVDQLNDENVSSSPNTQADSIYIRESKVYIDSKSLGRLTIGQQSTAADNITSINVSNAVHIATPAHQIYMGSFRPRQADGTLAGLRFNSLMGGDGSNTPGDSDRFDVIRYDTPSIAGFKVSASWGEDDYWDVALRYGGLLFGRVKAAGGIAYSVQTDTDPAALEPTSTTGKNGCVSEVDGALNVIGDVDCSQWGLSGSAMDVPTGLYVYAAAGETTDDNTPDGQDDTNSFWYVQAGIEKNWTGYGATTIFGELEQFDSGYNLIFTGVGSGAGEVGITSIEGAEVNMWGIGINQHFDAAALDVYLKFNHYSATADGVTNLVTPTVPAPISSTGDVDYEDFYTIYTGARIRF